jgi:hypothetical protein
VTGCTHCFDSNQISEANLSPISHFLTLQTFHAIIPLKQTLKTEKAKMILNDKQDCIESIARILEKTSAWRSSTAAKFPGDPRNAKAAETLNQLAVDAANLTDEQWNVLQPYFGWASQTWRDGLVQAARLVGFAHRNTNFASFVRSVVRQLPTSRVAA